MKTTSRPEAASERWWRYTKGVMLLHIIDDGEIRRTVSSSGVRALRVVLA